MTAPSYIAAQAIASIVNTAWAEQSMPTCNAALAPKVSPETGEEAMPAAYAIPTGHSLTRPNRASVANEMEVALVLVIEAATDETALNALALMDVAAKAVLAAGRSENVAFISATTPSLCDSALLANARIFRSQVNFTCVSHSPLTEESNGN